MAQPKRRMQYMIRGAAIIAILALCAGIPYTLQTIGLSHYRNTSPPLATTANGVTLALAHSRYLIIDTITVTLTNRSNAPIYVPGEGTESMEGAQSGLRCWKSKVEYLSAHGWQAVGSGCGWSPPECFWGAARGPQYPTAGEVAPGQTIVLDSYSGDNSYPPLTPGSYRFSVVFSLTPIQQTRPPVSPKISTPVKLTTTSVTLMSAWWIPNGYHQYLDCPRMPA